MMSVMPRESEGMWAVAGSGESGAKEEVVRSLVCMQAGSSRTQYPFIHDNTAPGKPLLGEVLVRVDQKNGEEGAAGER